MKPSHLVFLSTPMETFTPTNSGAIATVIWELSRRAMNEGVDVTVLSRASSIAPYRDVPTIFVDYPDEPKGGPALAAYRAQRKLAGWTHLRQFTYARRLAAAIREHGLHEHKLVMFNDPEMAVFLRRRFPSLFILHWFHNQLPCKASSRRDYGRAATVTAAVSDFTGRWIADYYGLPPNAVKTLYNGVDAERFTPGEKQKGKPVINFLGRTGMEKAPDLLLSAAQRLSERTKEFGLQIVGSNHWGAVQIDDYQRQLQRQVGELQQRGITVRLTGHVDRPSLPGVIRQAHIHVVPSRWDEAFGLTTLEGMASGLATVASATGGTPEVVGDAGLLFERDNTAALADRLAELVLDETHRRDMAIRGRRRAEEFTWEKAWRRLARLLDETFSPAHAATLVME